MKISIPANYQGFGSRLAFALLAASVLLVPLRAGATATSAPPSVPPTDSSASHSSQQQLRAKLGELASFAADFEQTVTDYSGEVLQQATGRIYLQQPQQLHWRVLPPNEALLVADGSTLWHVDPFVEQVIAMDQTAAVKDHPVMLLADPNGAAWQNYQVSVTDNGFKIVPQQAAKGIQSLQLTFAGTHLQQVLITDHQRQTNLLSFSNITQDQAIAPEMFEFTMPAGYELDDQR